MSLANPEHAYRELVPTLAPGERFEQHHLKVRRSDLSRFVLLPGSHLRGRLLAELLDDARVVSATRGYYLYSGTHQGVPLSVCSTGMGGPAAAIALEELGALGCDTFLRVGSAGAVAPHLGVGDVVVASECLRGGGTGLCYAPREVPALADTALTAALAEAAHALGPSVHVGLCASSDAFYAPGADAAMERLREAGVLALEMEAETLFVVARVRGWRMAAGMVLDGGDAREVGESSSDRLVIADHATHRSFREGEALLMRACIDALCAVARG